MYVVHITRADDILGNIAFESKHDAEVACQLPPVKTGGLQLDASSREV